MKSYLLTNYFDPKTGYIEHGSKLALKEKKQLIKLPDLQVSQNQFMAEKSGNEWIITRNLYNKKVEIMRIPATMTKDPNEGFGIETCECGNITREAECELCGNRLRS